MKSSSNVVYKRLHVNQEKSVKYAPKNSLNIFNRCVYYTRLSIEWISNLVRHKNRKSVEQFLTPTTSDPLWWTFASIPYAACASHAIASGQRKSGPVAENVCEYRGTTCYAKVSWYNGRFRSTESKDPESSTRLSQNPSRVRDRSAVRKQNRFCGICVHIGFIGICARINWVANLNLKSVSWIGR